MDDKQPTPSDVTDEVAQLYEGHPYPMREPLDERDRLLRTELDDLMAVNFHCFGGLRRFDRDFSILVAGGGTGDALIYMAHQLRETETRLVYLDISLASMQVAQERARVRGLYNQIEWTVASLLDLPNMDLGTFDYINCSGVLHHLEDPEAGLKALTSVLAPGGAIGLMLYGQYGRTGVYQIQTLMRLLNDPAAALTSRVHNTRAVLQDAPSTNWYKRGWGKTPVRYDMDDTELVDMFLHPCDQAYTVPGLYKLLHCADLNLVNFTADQRMLYDIRYASANKHLVAAVSALSLPDRRAAAELFHGVIGMHAFWASKGEKSRANLEEAENVPFFSHAAREYGFDKTVVTAAGQAWTLRLGPPGGPQLAFTVRPDAIGQRFLELVDGRATMASITDTITTESGEDNATVWKQCLRMVRQLLTCDLLLLRHCSVPDLPQRHVAT